MASYEVTESKHATFTGTTADLITFTIPWQVVRIVNKDASDVVYFTCNSTTAPTAAVAGSHIVRPGESVVYASKAPIKYVYLVGDGGDYSVEGFPGFGSSASSSGGSSTVAVTGMLVDDAAFTPATSSVLPAGFQADEAATDSVDEGDAGAARMTLDRKVITTPQPHTAGGLSVFNASAQDSSTALTNGAQAVKASAGQLYGWAIFNPNSVTCYVPVYDTASGSVTVGTTVPLFTLSIPATSAAHVLGTHGISFATAISVAAVMTTEGGNTAPTTALNTSWFYK